MSFKRKMIRKSKNKELKIANHQQNDRVEKGNQVGSHFRRRKNLLKGRTRWKVVWHLAGKKRVITGSNNSKKNYPAGKKKVMQGTCFLLFCVDALAQPTIWCNWKLSAWCWVIKCRRGTCWTGAKKRKKKKMERYHKLAIFGTSFCMRGNSIRFYVNWMKFSH